MGSQFSAISLEKSQRFTWTVVCTTPCRQPGGRRIMQATRWTRVLAAVVISGACLVPVQAAAQGNGHGRDSAPGQLKKQNNRDDYYRGYQQGLRDGEQD